MPHLVSQNQTYVNALIPRFRDPVAEQKMKEQDELSDDAPIDPKTMLDPSDAMVDSLDSRGNTEYATISGALETYKLALIDKQKAIDMIQGNIYMDRSKEQTKDYIVNSLAAIAVAEGEGPKARSALYTQFLQDGLKQVRTLLNILKTQKL
ncbi:MAG: hypothetical protein CM15mV42_1180 [uncultured marine virus]|nr:MAG: hypothetical protein CM15mV42_1180 [uncultured marine virus]